MLVGSISASTGEGPQKADNASSARYRRQLNRPQRTQSLPWNLSDPEGFRQKCLRTSANIEVLRGNQQFREVANRVLSDKKKAPYHVVGGDDGWRGMRLADLMWGFADRLGLQGASDEGFFNPYGDAQLAVINNPDAELDVVLDEIQSLIKAEISCAESQMNH